MIALPCLPPECEPGNWKEKLPVFGAVAVPHPDGGYTVAVPIGIGVRDLRGRYDDMTSARVAAHRLNTTGQQQQKTDQ
jgi:hypothetical protein